MNRLYLLDDCSLRLPYIDFLVTDHLAALENDLLSSIELRHKRLSSVAGRVCRDLLLNMLGKLQVLINLSIHL